MLQNHNKLVASLLVAAAIHPLVAFSQTTPAAATTPAPTSADTAAKTDSTADRAGINSIEKTDFDGQGKNIKVVLKDVAELFGFNVNIPDELDGAVSDSYRGITWKQFYTQVLAKKGYSFRIENDIVIIEKQKVDLSDNVTLLESGTISVNFVKVPVADAVAAICKKLDKNYSPLPADLESAGAQQPGVPAAGPKLITITWKGVAWQRTLQEILARYNYGFREEEGIIRVLPLEVLNNIPSETRVYRVNFADADKVAKTVTEVYKASGKDAAASLTATAETTQQLVIVTAKPDFLRNSEAKILELISQIDQPSKQVVIESRIIEKTWNNDFQLGFKYAYGAGSNNRGSRVTNNIDGSNAGDPAKNTSSSAGQAGSLPASGTSSPFAFVLSEKDFKFFMTALETDKTANILQNPTIVVKDDGQGAIRVIRRQPYFEQSQQASVGATTTTFTTKFINIGTSLYLKPKIKSNNYIELKIDQLAGGGPLTGGGSSDVTEGNGGISVTSKFSDVANPGGGFVPETDNRDVRTTVLLKDGNTVALGGLIKDADNRKNSQVPLLGDIPVIGRLFQSNETGKERLNLMAFITARVIDPYNSSYKEILGMDRINDLGLSSREIEGSSYRISDAEREALEELQHKRDLDANARKAANLNGELNESSK